jgi:hypothetical protein
VLAVGVGMQEVDIALYALTPLPGQAAQQVLARDQGPGNQAALGGAKVGCYKWGFPVAIHAKYVVTATKGNGVGAAALYMK